MSKKSGAVLERATPVVQQSTLSINTSGAAHQHTLRNIGLIAIYEFRKRIRQRSFIVVTIIMLVLVVLGACAPTAIQYFTATSSSQTKMVVVNNAGSIAGMNDDALSRYIGTALNGTATQTPGAKTAVPPPFAIRTVPASSSISDLQKQLKDGAVSILLVLDRAANGEISFTYYTSASGSSLAGDPHLSGVQALAGQLNVLDKAARLGLSPAQTGSLFAPPDFNVVNTGQNSRSVADTVTGYILAYVGILLIFMSVYMYGYGVATGVAEEKSSRIMEILVNAATPFQLMVGKIVGIGAAGLAQMAAFVVVGIGALLLQTPLKALLLSSNAGGLNLDITSASVTILLLLLVYFLLGFLLYATLFAAVGALVKRQEDLQNVVQPVMWLFTIGYLVSFFGIYSPDAAWVKAISYIPFWTPTTMLMRIGTGAVSWWEIALTIALMLVAIYLCAVISARIYRFGVLMYGQKPGLRQLLRLARRA
ncbi:MAG TPA: ABC transporter permease [Ktedonobacteraceae bacterium]|nr:ABC transporter permease [Ktedonobacteraceae bacterium]